MISSFDTKKTVTNSRCDEDQSMMCEAAASSRQACQNILHEQIWILSISYFTSLSYWCWCQTVMITFVSFVNVQNEIDIRSDNSHNHSYAFVVCSSSKINKERKPTQWFFFSSINIKLGPHCLVFIAPVCHVFSVLG